ncbi:MAG: hypothetical protein KAK04_09050 [Cyclobacteriaceae bacterium]|nr:hypothetical protein [Cyclobacteriaceae bacterium]
MSGFFLPPLLVLSPISSSSLFWLSWITMLPAYNQVDRPDNTITAKSEKADPKRVGLFLLNAKISSLLLDPLIFDVTQKGDSLPCRQSA